MLYMQTKVKMQQVHIIAKKEIDVVCVCRNPTLAKCEDETHTPKSWGLGVLRNSRMFRVRQKRPKHLGLGCSWCHWKGLEV